MPRKCTLSELRKDRNFSRYTPRNFNLLEEGNKIKNSAEGTKDSEPSPTLLDKSELLARLYSEANIEQEKIDGGKSDSAELDGANSDGVNIEHVKDVSGLNGSANNNTPKFDSGKSDSAKYNIESYNEMDVVKKKSFGGTSNAERSHEIRSKQFAENVDKFDSKFIDASKYVGSREGEKNDPSNLLSTSRRRKVLEVEAENAINILGVDSEEKELLEKDSAKYDGIKNEPTEYKSAKYDRVNNDGVNINSAKIDSYKNDSAKLNLSIERPVIDKSSKEDSLVIKSKNSLNKTYTESTINFHNNAIEEVNMLRSKNLTFGVDTFVVDRLFARIPTPAACVVYMYLWRRTIGQGQEKVRLSAKVIGDVLNLSKRTIILAIRDLNEIKLVHTEGLGQQGIHEHKIIRDWK